tara:strand:- start:1221 stop:2096 length:876 start_codon:yes stop_codon:yes gene_type:complete
MAKKKAKKVVSKKKATKKTSARKKAPAKKKVAKKATKKVASKKTAAKKQTKVKSTKKKTSKKTTTKAKVSKLATTKKKSAKKKASKKVKSATKKTKKNQLPLDMEGWPSDRKVIFNPERFKYLNRAKTDSCVFCAAANYGPAFESLSLYKDSHVQVILNKYPYHVGHIMVMPVRHVGNLEELGETEYLEIMKMLRRSVAILKEVYNCGGVNAGINLGRDAGAGIPDHLHWHIIPRWAGDTNFFPAIAMSRVISESLAESYKKLSPHFKVDGEQLSLPGSAGEKQVEFKLEE